MATSDDLYVLTGAPGTGKTTLLDHLDGIRRVAEPAREILAEQRTTGGRGVPNIDPATFVRLLLERSIEEHARAIAAPEPTLFDRGLPDCVAYATYLGVDGSQAIEAAAAFRYRPDVFLLDPWEEIYTTDDERVMTFADTERFHAHVLEAYDRAGYLVVDVPRATSEERAAFVRNRIEIRQDFGRSLTDS